MAELLSVKPLPDLMKPAEAAAELRMSEKTLANQRSRREGPPFIRISGGAIRYSRTAISAWLVKQTVTPQDGAA